MEIISISYFLLQPLLRSVFFNGNHEVYNAILDSWNIRDKSVENVITFLSWSLEFNVRLAFAQGKAFTENGFLFPPLIWLIIVFFVFYLIVNLSAYQNKNKDLLKHRKFLFIIVLLQFCTIIPLIILGCDYGRWIFFWSSTSIAPYFFISDQWIILINYSMKITDSFILHSSVFTTDKSSLVILLFTLAIPSFVMDSQTYLNSTFIYPIILKLSSIFIIII